MLGKDERSSTLPVPLTWKQLRPEGFEARWLRSIFAAGVGVEEVDVIARAGERGDVREVDLAGGSGAVRSAGAAGLDRQILAAEGRQRGHARKRDHGAVAGRRPDCRVIEVICAVATVAEPSTFRSVGQSVVRSGSSKVPPEEMLISESLAWSEIDGGQA